MTTRKKDPTIGELIAKSAELGIKDEAAARALIKAHKVRSYKKLSEVIAAQSAEKSGDKPKRRRVTGILHKEGPRGFKMGPVWLQSIRQQKGVAMKPSNRPKLEKTAAAYGLDSSGMEHHELVAAIAKAMGTRREPIPPKVEEVQTGAAA